MYHYEKKYIFKDGEDIVVRKKKAENPMKLHTHDFIEVVYIVSGKGKQLVDGKEYAVERRLAAFYKLRTNSYFYFGRRNDFL